MTHKYLTQIRTIPNYQQDQSDFAKTWRSISYSFKSTANLLVKNRKTRIIASVLGVYTVITSGFMVAFINVENNQANAQSFVTTNGLEINIKKQKVEFGNIFLKLDVKNKTNQTIVEPIFKFQSSYNNVQWISSFNETNNNKIDAIESNFQLANIGPSQTVVYNIYGKLNNPQIDNIAVDTIVKYSSENLVKEVNSPKFLIEISQGLQK
jgi:cyclophilin family peptidyl-prolyl cis-trans isomerase